MTRPGDPALVMAAMMMLTVVPQARAKSRLQDDGVVQTSGL